MNNSYSIILACGSRGELGYNQQLLWNLPKDMARFVRLTKGSNVIMGRNTYLSLPRNLPALPGRTNIVLTSKPEEVLREYESRLLIWNKAHPKLMCVSTIEEAGELCNDKTINPDRYDMESFIIGGGTLYNNVLERGLVHRIYRTMVHHQFNEADTFVKHLDYGSLGFIPKEVEHISSDVNNVYFMTFEKWERINKG